MKEYKHLVRTALDAGHAVSVWDGEEWAVKRGHSFNDIVEAIESVEVAELKIWDGEKSIGWALIIPFGVEDYETVADYTMTPFMLDWELKYKGAYRS